MFAYPILLIPCLLALRFFVPGGKICSRVLVSIFVFAASQLFIYRFLGGNQFSPDLPGWFMTFICLCLGFMLCCVFPSLLILPFAFWKERRKLFSKILLAGYAVCLPVTGVLFYNATRLPIPIEHEISIFPEHSGKPIRIAQITDLHVNSFVSEEWFDGFLEILDSMHPDVVVFTGDIVDGTPENKQPFLTKLSNIKAPLGMYFVPGNHEYYCDYDGWLGWFRSIPGMNVLENAHMIIESDGRKIAMVGVTDERAKKYEGRELPDYEKAVSGMELSDAIILLKHRPSPTEWYKDSVPVPDLVLSGHTHGGMVPLTGWLVKLLNYGFTRGMYDIGGVNLFIGDGTFLWSGFPFRMGTENAINLFILR